MVEIAAGEFKAKCLALIDRVKETREPVTITKRGRPVAQLVPIPARNKSAYGIARGTATYDPDDDLFSTGEVWDAEA